MARTTVLIAFACLAVVASATNLRASDDTVYEQEAANGPVSPQCWETQMRLCGDCDRSDNDCWLACIHDHETELRKACGFYDANTLAADPEDDPRYYEVVTVALKTPDGKVSEQPAGHSLKGIPGLPIDPTQIVQIGKDIWQLIEDNTPVVDYNTDFGGAVPQGIDDWTQLEGWKSYESDEYEFEFKNFLGIRLTRFKWKWTMKHSGSYNDGSGSGSTGKYVTQAGVRVKNVYATLTQNVNVKVTAHDPVNYGSHEDPVGGVDVQVIMTSHGKIKSTTVGCTMTFKGDGSTKLGACDQH